MKEWEKLFWFLRFLIPGLHVDVAGRDDLKDLLDQVDLNTYGLRRTTLNEAVKLDDSPSVLDPNKPAMAGAGQDDPDNKLLDEIVKIFNEWHFSGWDASPDDQKAKMFNIALSIKADKDYQDLVVGNPDPDAVETTMGKVIDRVIRQKRAGDMSLYKQYQQNADFKVQLRNVLIRLTNTLESAPKDVVLPMQPRRYTLPDMRDNYTTIAAEP